MPLDGPLDASNWHEIEDWVRTSYTLVAPNTLGRRAIESNNATHTDSAASARSAPSPAAGTATT